jgi:hypothetical protein
MSSIAVIVSTLVELCMVTHDKNPGSSTASRLIGGGGLIRTSTPVANGTHQYTQNTHPCGLTLTIVCYIIRPMNVRECPLLSAAENVDTSRAELD